jgi:Cytochrome c oxidase assembly protein CtaG/Cox11
MKRHSKGSWQLILLPSAFFILLVPVTLYLPSADQTPPRDEPLGVVKAYLKASYARDYPKAYQYIASQDQRVWDEKSYALQNGSFNGFALEVAHKLAENMEVWVIDRQISQGRARYTVGYKVPTADELSSLLFDWDPEKLNALSPPLREQLLANLEKIKKADKMITVKGQETFELIADQGRWKIFYDWASGTKVKFNISLPPSAAIHAQLFNTQLVVKNAEPFQISLKVKNRSQQAVLARIVHHVEPRNMENHIDMIACGALQPLELQPGEIQEISSAYIVTDRARAGANIAITYEFQIDPVPSNKSISSKTKTPNKTPRNSTPTA